MSPLTAHPAVAYVKLDTKDVADARKNVTVQLRPGYTFGGEYDRADSMTFSTQARALQALRGVVSK